MAEDIPFDEVFDPWQLDDDHEQPVSDFNDDFQLPSELPSVDNNAVKKSYLGTRRDRSGKWVRRHCSEKRYPRMAGKVNASSPLPSPVAGELRSDEFVRHENKQSPGHNKGRIRSNSRQKMRHQKHNQEQQQMSSRQSDYSQQKPLHIHIESEKHIQNKVVHENHITRSKPASKQIPSYGNPQPYHSNAPSQFKEHNKHDVDVLANIGRRQTRQKKHKLIFDVSSLQANQNDKKPTASTGDEISGLFTASSKMTSATKQQIFDGDDEERIRRFGDAYNAIMLAHQNNEVKPPEPRPSYSGKRWVRDPNVVSAMSIDGRSYSDLQRTPTLSLKQMMTSPDVYDSNKGMLNVELHDRKASWLVHMPRTSSKYSGKEKQLFRVEEESTMNAKEFSTSYRKEATTEEVAGLTPCHRKLNDIETTIQSVEIGQKFDLEENRRAVVQAGLPSRQKIVGQRDSTYSLNRKFDQFTIDEESTTAGRRTVALGRTSDNYITEAEAEAEAVDDNNSGIDSTPIVKTSALRLLFSGHSDVKPIEDSKESNKRSVPRKSQRSLFPTSSNGHAFNQIEEGESGSEKSAPQHQHRNNPSTSSNNFKTTESLKSMPQNQMNMLNPETSSDGYLELHIEKETNDTNVHLQLDPSTHRPDPPDSVNQRTSSPQREEAVPQLNVADLVRASLVSRALSFIDTDENLDDFDEEEEQIITRSMLMSPSLITKRYQQVLGAIEAKNWEQVSYLTHANPWLMEMKDVRNDQCLIHSLALYGGQTDSSASSDQLSIQEEIVSNILAYEPGVVHRLDSEGYLPLHMAAASGNTMMIKILGEKFPAAASVQNHDGLLCLHLAVMSCALYATGEHAVDLILNLFPAGVVVKDNDGNTPLHTATGALRGNVGVSIVSRLLQVHDDILSRDPAFLKGSMCQPKVPKHFDEVSVVTLDDVGEESTDWLLPMTKNNRGETPLVRAIKSKAGRQVIDTLLGADGGSLAALEENSSGASALHLILQNDFYDAAVAISVLKSAPSAAAIRDVNRILPIQIACSNSLQREIILAIAIIDLPIDLGAKEDVIVRNGFGESWWFLVCESNDKYVDIVTEILALCSHQQKMALCLTTAGSSNEDSAVTCATPKCKAALREGLRFLGRFEFTSGDQSNFPSSRKVQKFDAIDYGHVNGEKKVSIICYGSNEVYAREAEHLHESNLDMKFYEEFEHFAVGDSFDANIPSGVKLYHCVAVTKSKLSLSRVLAGMPRNHGYRKDHNLLKRYFSKVKSIMFRVGEGICKLHDSNIIHGQIDSNSIMKFGDRWKITGLCGSVVRGSLFSTTRIGAHSPPEAFVVPLNESSLAQKSATFVAEPSADIWAFGKLIFEAFVGESIFASFVSADDEDLQTRFIVSWNTRHVKVLMRHLEESGIDASGVDLVVNCLQLESNRTKSMASILRHGFWKDK